MTELEKDINNLRSGLKSVESVSHGDLSDGSRSVLYRQSCHSRSPLVYPQELDYQKKRPQELGDKFVSVVSQFITVASFSFSDVEDSLAEAKELVSGRHRRGISERTASLSLSGSNRESWLPVSSVQLLLHASLTPSATSPGKLTVGVKCSGFLPLNRRCFISQTSHCLSHRGLSIALLHYSPL